jgi:hypothetical protein
LKILDDAYVKDIYNTNLLANEVKYLESIFSETAFSVIIEKKGNLEMVKKIIEYYLNYVVEINFDAISKINFKNSESFKKTKFDRGEFKNEL